MVVRFGMTPELGQVSYEPDMATFLAGPVPVYRPRTYADRTAATIDNVIKNLIETAYGRAYSILEQHREILTSCAQELLRRETLSANDWAKLTTELNRSLAPKPHRSDRNSIDVPNSDLQHNH